jgi:sugar transferase EpsL
MNQTNFDLDANKHSSTASKERTTNFIRGLGAYFAAVLTNISLLIVVAIFVGWKTPEVTSLFSYLAFSLLLLFLYSAATTRTVTISTNYRLLQILKRLIDVIIAALGIFFLAPLFILLAIMIRIESPGPILFRSKRVGQFGKPFDVYKFRTMYLAPADPPLTNVGKFLRRYHINELPSLLNVLNGEMSLVGPRPRHLENLDETLDSENKILSVRPGITSLGAISRASDKDLVDLDLKYIEDWSLVLDFKICVKTFLVTFTTKF